MKKLIALIGVLLLAGLGYLYVDSQRQLQHYQQEAAALQLQLDALRQDVLALEKKVHILDKSSVQGIVRDTNSALLEGWKALMSTVEKEIRKAGGATADPSPAPADPPPAQGDGAAAAPAAPGKPAQ